MRNIPPTLFKGSLWCNKNRFTCFRNAYVLPTFIGFKSEKNSEIVLHVPSLYRLPPFFCFCKEDKHQPLHDVNANSNFVSLNFCCIIEPYF